MPVQPIPEGYQTITPYIIVVDASGLLTFLEEAFGAEVIRVTYGPEREDGRRMMMNAEVKVGSSMVMLADARGEMLPQPVMLYVYVDDVDGVHARAMRAGASEMMPPTDMFYGDRHGGIVDPAGNTWFIASHIEDMTDEELQHRADEFHADHQG